MADPLADLMVAHLVDPKVGHWAGQRVDQTVARTVGWLVVH